MIVELGPGALPRLRQLAKAEVNRWPIRSTSRHTAVALWEALDSSRTVPGARRALDSLSPLTRQSATDLLHQLAARVAAEQPGSAP